MNLGFMQQLEARKKQGENLGSAASLLQTPGQRLGQGLNVNPAHAGLTPAAPALAKAPRQAGKLPEDFQKEQPQGELTLGATFANEIVRRMGEQAGENGEVKDPTDLRHSLGQTMDWVRERFGDETAAAAAGMVLQSTSSGVNEETLGEGLLNTLKFIDRNFGIAAGDAAIGQFNQSINVELNNYFENGKAEVFHASTTSVEGPSPTQELSSRLFMRSVQEPKSGDKDEKTITEQLLEDLKAELDKTAELQDLTSKLEEQFNPANIAKPASAAAYTEAPVPTEPQLTSIAV